MNRSWYCDECELAWPFYGHYQKCNICDGPCDATDHPPIEVPRARAIASEAYNDREVAREKRAKYAEFERKYADREVAAFQEELDSWLTAQL